MTKQQARKAARAARDAVTKEQLLARSRAVWERLFASPRYAAAKSVFCYLSFGSEVDTRAAVAAMAREKAVYLPRMLAGSRMEAVRYEGEASLLRNAYGIEEPTGSRTLSAEKLDLAVVPGVAFDRETLHRVGYGRGYYDRFLTGTSLFKIGLALECQLVTALEADRFDVAMDVVLTESAAYGARVEG